MGAMGPAVQNGSQNTGAKGMGSNSSNGSSSVGAPTGKGMAGSVSGNGNVTYPGQGGQPAIGQAPMQQNNQPNPYQNTIQPWNVSGMTGQNTNNFHAGKGKGA